jgi:hypothetical protein
MIINLHDQQVMINFNIEVHDMRYLKHFYNHIQILCWQSLWRNHGILIPKANIFIERDGERVRYVLDYLQDETVNLPPFLSRDSLLMDLKFYGIDNVKEESISVPKRWVHLTLVNAPFLAHDVFKSWEKDKIILEECITKFKAFKAFTGQDVFYLGLTLKIYPVNASNHLSSKNMFTL